MPLPVLPHCESEPTARQGFPSAHAARRFGARDLAMTGVGILWIMNGWVVGAGDPAVTADLAAPVTATWSGIGLRPWAERVSETAGRPVLIDRRMNPDTAISLECQNEPLLEVLTRAATIAGGELAVLESSIRIVPRGRADLVLRAEAARTAELTSLPPRSRSMLANKEPWQWPAGARPRDLLADAATQAGIALEGIDSVPHDHLPAASLPEMALAERLDLLLASFDLRIDWRVAETAADPRGNAAPTGRVIPIASGIASRPATAAAGKPRTRAPTGTPTGRRPAPPQKAAVRGQTFSLEVAAPLEEALTAIATRLELQLELDRESFARKGIAPGEIVRARVTNASRDELLRAILDPLDLDWAITGTTLRVFAPGN